jgi:DNA-binding protein HU-beta
MTKIISKTEFVGKLSEKLETSKEGAHKTLSAVIESVQEALQDGTSIQLTGFGKFTVTETKAKTIQSFGKEVHVQAGKRISFKPGAELKTAVK